MKVAIYTLGCKVNIYESEYVTDLLIKNGYKIVSFDDDADIYIINTCSVTNEADKKDRKVFNKIKNKNAIKIVMGCFTQAGNEIEADIVIGNKDKSKIIKLIDEYLQNKDKINVVTDISNISFENMEITNFAKHSRAFVKVQDGCNAYCSYCIIPYVRGNVRSKKLDDVIAEVTKLCNNGYKEVVLTGIHTGRYGIDINTNLETLLRRLVEIPNLYRLRLSSIEINEITDGIVNLMKTSDKIAKHLHIPLQSGSDTILKMMNRKYDVKYFLDKVDYLRKEIKDISLTTDLIVGFPGEDEKLFKETIDTLNTIKFTKIHTFPYSKRKGTPASVMTGQVDNFTKKQRVKDVLKLSLLYEKEFYYNHIGKVYDVILEKRHNKMEGYTSNYISVIINDARDFDNNDIIKVIIDKIEDNIVIGTIKNQ